MLFDETEELFFPFNEKERQERLRKNHQEGDSPNTGDLGDLDQHQIPIDRRAQHPIGVAGKPVR